jgi:hypothetical protein
MGEESMSYEENDIDETKQKNKGVSSHFINL